jgi:hypothetical protein
MYGNLARAPSAQDIGLAYSNYIISQSSGVTIEILLYIIQTVDIPSKYVLSIFVILGTEMSKTSHFNPTIWQTRGGRITKEGCITSHSELPCDLIFINDNSRTEQMHIIFIISNQTGTKIFQLLQHVSKNLKNNNNNFFLLI